MNVCFECKLKRKRKRKRGEINFILFYSLSEWTIFNKVGDYTKQKSSFWRDSLGIVFCKNVSCTTVETKDMEWVSRGTHMVGPTHVTWILHIYSCTTVVLESCLGFFVIWLTKIAKKNILVSRATKNACLLWRYNFVLFSV
jgi:hypothetical protein